MRSKSDAAAVSLRYPDSCVSKQWGSERQLAAMARLHELSASQEQAEALDAALEKRGTQVDAVVRLMVDEQELVARMEKRAAEEGRADDNIDAFKVRLKAYQDQTAPLLPFYAAQGKLKEVEGMGSMEDVAARIAAALDTK